MQEMVRFCESKFGRVDVVIHGAAILIERQLVATSYEDYLSVVRTRGLGTANLLSALSNLQHKPIVMNLGTGGARFGSPGLTAYGSGHQLAAALVKDWGEAFSACSKTLVFGPWLDVGMTRQGNSAERFRKKGIDFITPKKGSAFFLNELKSWDRSEVVLRGKPASAFGQENSTASHPMIDSWEKTGDQIIEAVGLFSPAIQPWIERHRIAGEPYLPGVYGLELMVATTSFFRPELKLVSISDVHWKQPLRFPGGRERAIRVCSEVISDSHDGLTCRSTVYTVLPQTRERRVHQECLVELGKPNSRQESVLPEIREGVELFEPIRAKDLYAFFDEHCENPDRNFEYQSITAVNAMSHLGFSTTTKGDENQTLSGKLKIKNGILLDACVHSPYYYFFSENSTGLPLAVDRIEFFGALDWDNKASCRTLVREIHQDKIVSDIEMLDSEGKVLVRLTRYTCHLVEPSRNPNGKVIAKLVEQNGPLSRNADWALALGVEKLAITRVDFQHSESFVEHLASRLSTNEQKQLAQYSATHRRAEFVAGRIAAKGSWLQFHNDASQRFQYSDLSAVSERGRPPHFEQDDVAITDRFLSLSHSEGTVVAAVCDQRIGIDVQKVSNSIEKIRDSFTNSSELDLVSRIFDEGTLSEKLTMIWAAKEAIIKASSSIFDMPSIVLKKINSSADRFRLIFVDSKKGEFSVIVAVLADEVVAMTCGSADLEGSSESSSAWDCSQGVILEEVNAACENEIGQRPDSVDEDLFFDLGCTSINAAQIIRRLESRFQIQIPLNLLLSFSSVSEIADLVAQKIGSQKKQTVKARDHDTPSSEDTSTLFWAQWSGPNFVRKYLPKSQKAHFFKGHWQDDSMDHLVDLKSIVSAYVDELRVIQPSGPYFLGGYCFGAIIVYEVAKVLQQMGHEVVHLFLLDPYLPYSAIPLAGDFSESETKAIRKVLKASYAPSEMKKKGDRITFGQIIRHLAWRLKQAQTRRRLKNEASSAEPLPAELRAEKVLRMYGEMIEEFSVQPYDGSVTVIANQLRPAIYRKIWEHLVPESGLRYFSTSCKNHHSLTSEPEIGIWIDKLIEALE